MRREFVLVLISCLAVFFLEGLVTETFADKGEVHVIKQQAQISDTVQRTCPVMEDNKIDPSIFTEYKGKKVYFCCPSCKTAFSKNPEKYLDRLPQFSGVLHNDEHKSHSQTGHSEGESYENLLPRFVEPFGIATLTLLLTTACAGYFMRKKPKVLNKWHRRLAYTTVTVALCHATLVFLTH